MSGDDDGFGVTLEESPSHGVAEDVLKQVAELLPFTIYVKDTGRLPTAVSAVPLVGHDVINAAAFHVLRVEPDDHQSIGSCRSVNSR